jgi:hypothetical protein
VYYPLFKISGEMSASPSASVVCLKRAQTGITFYIKLDVLRRCDAEEK